MRDKGYGKPLGGEWTTGGEGTPNINPSDTRIATTPLQPQGRHGDRWITICRCGHRAPRMACALHAIYAPGRKKTYACKLEMFKRVADVSGTVEDFVKTMSADHGRFGEVIEEARIRPE